MTTAQTEARAVALAGIGALRHVLTNMNVGLSQAQIVAIDEIATREISNAVRSAAVSALAAKDAEIAALKKEASKFAKWVEDYSNDGHIARAARSFLDKWEGRE